MDYYVEKRQHNQSTVECAHPVGSSSFYKFVPDEALKRCIRLSVSANSIGYILCCPFVPIRFDLLLLLPNRVMAAGEKRDLEVSAGKPIHIVSNPISVTS